MKKVKRPYYSLGGLFVRNATAVGKGSLRLELSPSDNEAQDFLRHLNKLGDSDSFVVEVPMEMLERMSSPEEFGNREHRLAMLQGNCINLKLAIAKDRSLEVMDASPDLSYVLAGNEKTGFRPTVRFNRVFRQNVRDVASSSVFNHVRSFFRDNHGFLLPAEEGQQLKPYQKNLAWILSPYCRSFCDSSDKSKALGYASFEGDYLTIEQRVDSIAGVLAAEDVFAKTPPNSPIHGKVTLSDILGTATENQWAQKAGEKLDKALNQTQRLGYAVSTLDNYVQAKLPLRIAASVEKRLGQALTNAQQEEVKQLFGQFMDRLVAESQQHLAPLDEFSSVVGGGCPNIPRYGLAVLNHVSRESAWGKSNTVKLSDGTEVDFSNELARLVADPRSFGIELPENGAALQQAAQVALLNYISRDLLRSYWDISEPIPCMAAIQALQRENEHKLTDRFTKRRVPLPNPADIYRKFERARELLTESVSNFLCARSGGEMVLAPKTILSRLMEKGGGLPEVSRARGLLLRNACAVFRSSGLSDEKVDSLLKEVAVLSGRTFEEYSKETRFLADAYTMTRAEAAAVLLLHEAIERNHTRLAEKLDEFGRKHVPDYHAKVETALDSRVRAQALTISALARMVSDSPEEVVRALNPNAQIQGELASSKAAAVSTAAMKSLHSTLTKSMEFFKTSLPSSIEFKNIEGSVYSGPQSAKIVSEIIEEKIEDAMADYFRLASVPDHDQREQLMNVHSATLAERAEHSKDAVEIEADAKCYPAGRSPKRAARDLLMDAFHKALTGQGHLEIDPYTFAPPSLA